MAFFSNISHQRMISLTPIVSRSKTNWYKHQKKKKKKEIDFNFNFNFTTIDQSNSDKR